MVKGKYINEKARAAYKEAEKKITPDIEKKSPITNFKEGLDAIRDSVLGCKDDMVAIRTDMVKMMEGIDKISMSVRVLATRLNRVDGMGK